MPGAGHGGDVVEQMALRLFDAAEVGHDLARLHDDLAQQQAGGADNLADHAHDAHQRVYLRQVAAVGAELFPDIGHRVKTDNIHALIAEEEHVLRHVVEDGGVCVVEIPLIGIEGGHDDLIGLRAPAEVAGRGGRENLGHGSFKLAGDVPVVVEEIAILKFLFTRAGAPGPLVILACMVHDEVEADRDVALVAVRSEGGQILHRAEGGLHFAEVRHGITAVAASDGAFQQGHQMQVVDAAVL